jgi:hypothetical protein
MRPALVQAAGKGYERAMRTEPVSPVGDVLVEELRRIEADLMDALDGLSADELRFRPGGTGNPVGWLAWHIARITDEQIAAVAGCDPTWTVDGWYDRFGLAVGPSDTGYGHSSEEVDATTVTDLPLLAGYAKATFDGCCDLLSTLDDGEWEQIIDRSFRPPVTVRVRVVSVIGDCWQHVGQARYAVGLARHGGPDGARS